MSPLERIFACYESHLELKYRIAGRRPLKGKAGSISQAIDKGVDFKLGLTRIPMETIKMQ